MRRPLPALGCTLGVVLIVGPGCATYHTWDKLAPDPLPRLSVTEPVACGVTEGGVAYVVARLSDGSLRILRDREDDREGRPFGPEEAPPRSAQRCIVVESIYWIEPGMQCRRVTPEGWIERHKAPLTLEEAAGATFVAFWIGPQRTDEAYFRGGGRTAVRLEGPPARDYTGGERVRAGLCWGLTPVTVAIDVATFPVQIPILLWYGFFI